jgi:integrase/recombinase XerD
MNHQQAMSHRQQALDLRTDARPLAERPTRAAGALVLEPHPDGRNDGRLVEMWLFGKAASTRQIYVPVVRDFVGFLLGERDASVVTSDLYDLQAYAQDVAQRPGRGGGTLSASTIKTKLAAVKSLLSFAHRIGYIRVNFGASVQLPSVRSRLAKRIVPRWQVQRLIAEEPDPAKTMLFEVMYFGAIRAREASGLTWDDVIPLQDLGGPTVQLDVWGKGEKSRQVRLRQDVGARLLQYREDVARPAGTAADRHAVWPSPDDPCCGLHPVTLWRYVKTAAERSGLPPEFSPHWFRHAHASHALDGGAPVHVVKDTLGHASLETTTKYSHARPGSSSSDAL